MHFFLCEIVARAVAVYLCFDCWRQLRHGFAERKIGYYVGGDLLDWLLDWGPRGFCYRDAAPIRYWMLMGGQITALAACAVIAVFGWLQTGT